MAALSVTPLAVIQTRHEQRQMQQRKQLSTISMPQKHDSHRSRQRMHEIQMYEEELRLQEAKACSMSEHERQILTSSFASVKFEFSDLDGLTWSPSAKRRILYSTIPVHYPVHPRSRTQSESGHFAVLSNADILPVNPEATIRPSSSLPAILATSFRSHFHRKDSCVQTESEDDEDPTPMPTPTQADFNMPQSFAHPTINTSRSLHIPPTRDVDKLILVDHSTIATNEHTNAEPAPSSYFDDQMGYITPALKEKRRFRVWLPAKHHGTPSTEKYKS